MADPLKSFESTKVDYRRLGKAGLKISVPILGAMSFGDKRWVPWVIPEEESLPILKAAYDAGLNTWDTANLYSNGRSEEIIGAAIRKYEIPRHKVVIMTKCHGTVGEEPGTHTFAHSAIIGQTKDYVNQAGLSRSAIFKAVNKSLERLGTDYIDLLQIHRFDPNTPIEETMEALHDLVKQGKVHYIGASSMWTYQFAMMQQCAESKGLTKFVSMQNHYSLLYREEEREMNKYCKETGVALVPWSPLARGYLCRPAESALTTRSEMDHTLRNGMFAGLGTADIDKKIIGRVEELAKKKGWTMTQVSLAWINERVTSPIVGFSSVKRMEEALAARGKVLDKDEVAYLEELYQPRRIFGHS